MLRTILKIIGITIVSIVVLIGVLVGLIVYQEGLETKCYGDAWPLRDSYMEKYPSGLVDISVEEKRELGIKEELTPYWQYYEARKCLKEKSFLL